MASIYENRFRRMAEMAGTDGQAGSVPVLATPSESGIAKLSMGLSIPDQIAALNGASQSVLRDRGVITFGDSRSDIEQDAVTNGLYAYTRGVFNIANALAGARMIHVRAAGVGGNTYADLVARYKTDVRPYAKLAGWLVIWCDVNDIIYGRSLVDMQADANQIYAWAEEDGLRVVEYAGYAPGSAAAWSAAAVQKLIQFNSWRKAQQLSRMRYHVIDAFRAITSTTSTTPTTANAYLQDYSGTALHIGVAGACKIAPQLQALFQLYVPVRERLVSSAADCYGVDPTNSNLFDFGMFQGTTGTKGTGAADETSLDSGFAAGVATGVTVQRSSGAGTCYVSTGPASDGVGNAQKLRITGTTIQDEIYQLGVSTSVAGRAVNGGTYQPACRVIVKNAVKLATVEMRLLCTVGGVSYESRAFAAASPTVGDLADGTYVLEVPPMRMPDTGSITVFTAQVRPIFNAAGGSAEIYVERMSNDRIS